MEQNGTGANQFGVDLPAKPVSSKGNLNQSAKRTNPPTGRVSTKPKRIGASRPSSPKLSNRTKKKRRRRKKRSPPVTSARVCLSVHEWRDATGISIPTTYRMMADGRLRYVELGERMRKIPVTEFVRLGLTVVVP